MTKTTRIYPRPLARAIAVASLPLLALGSAAASAQSDELQELRDRIQKLEAQQAAQETGTAPETADGREYLTRDGAGMRIGDTTMTIGGFIKADIMAGSNGNGWANAYSIGLPRTFAGFAKNGEGDDWKTGFSARESRLSLGTKTLDVAGHTLTTYVEADFNQGADAPGNEYVSNSYGLRLRQAYGSWNGWDFGQTHTTFSGLAAIPEILDLGKQAAFIYGRQPMVRYNASVPGGKLRLALENPEDGFGPSYDDQSYPDLVARYDVRNDFGIYSIAGLVRSLEDDAADQTKVAGAVSLSARIPTIGRDDLRLQYSYGALGRYMGLLSYPEVDRSALADGEVEPINTFGATAAYRYFWSANWRSNLSLSHTEIADDIKGPGSTLSYFDSASSVHANLLWSASPKLTLGLEYAYWDFSEIDSGGRHQYEQVMGSATMKF
jgi:hypothetical protein